MTHIADCILNGQGTCDNWCYGCCRCEPLGENDYLVCGECRHVFHTASDLVDAHRNYTDASYVGKADHILFCPICVHDF